MEHNENALLLHGSAENAPSAVATTMPTVTISGDTALPFVPISSALQSTGVANVEPQLSLEQAKILSLKCPSIRNHLATFQQENAESGPLDLAQSVFDLVNSDNAGGGNESGPPPSAMEGKRSWISCVQVGAADESACPSGGCVRPCGTIAQSPIELLDWHTDLHLASDTVLAQSVVTSEFGIGLVCTLGGTLAYERGAYSPIDDQMLTKRIMPHLGPFATIKRADVIRRTINVVNLTEQMLVPSPNHIAFANGTYDVEGRKLGNHNAAHMLGNRIPHNYQPEAQCPCFLGFLDQIWQGDEDKTEKIEFLQQWLGYLLVADSSQQVMVILKGEGKNGKSILMDVCRALVGEPNAESAMLNRLQVPSVRAILEGMLLNQSADLPKLGLISDGQFKAIVSGDSIEVSAKHKSPHTIKPYVKLMAATNDLPHTKDGSDGFFRRLIILSFNRKFTEQERVPYRELLESLFAEMPGVVAWAIEGLHKLRTQGQFTVPSTSAQEVNTYRGEGSPTRMFAEECLEPTTTGQGFVPTDLFQAFDRWCRQRHFNPGNIVVFGRDLRRIGFEQRKSGRVLWRVQVKEAAREYFAHAHAQHEAPSAPTNVTSLPSSTCTIQTDQAAPPCADVNDQLAA